MPDIYDNWSPMNPPSAQCPLCDSCDVQVEEETEQTTAYVCNSCSNKWEEYR